MHLRWKGKKCQVSYLQLNKTTARQKEKGSTYKRIKQMPDCKVMLKKKQYFKKD